MQAKLDRTGEWETQVCSPWGAFVRSSWQAYASNWLTGGFVLYGYCAKGFVVDRVFGTPEATPSHSTEPRDPSDAAKFDPEGAADSGKKQMHLAYTCLRKPD